MPTVTGLLPSQAFGAYPDPAPRMAYMSRSGSGSSSSVSPPDAISDSVAYFEWLNSFGHQGQASGKHIWPTYLRTHDRHCNSDTSMPDYMAVPPCADPMTLSGGSMEEDPMTLLVPNNTPAHGGGAATHFPLPSHASAIPADLAPSLTNSLLNQPLPIPIPILTQTTNLPASDIKSKKEHKHLTTPSSDPSPIASAILADPGESLKDSQPTSALAALHVPAASASAGLEPMGTSPNSNLQALFSADVSRTPSTDDFGASIDICSLHVPLDCPDDSFSSSAQGAKRIRTFTTASAKTINEEDEPRHSSQILNLVGVQDHGGM